MSLTWTIRSAAFFALALTACVPPPDDRTQRYAGDLRACEPVVTGEAQTPERHPGDALSDHGPFPVWNTHPGAGCNDNIIMPYAGSRTVTAVTGDEFELEFRDVQAYVTYPAQTDPSVTGAADVADGRFGIVVFAHANNDSVCQIFESYYSLQDHWASWGWVVASVDGTSHNCDRGNRTNIELRADGMVAAVQRLRELNDDPDSRFHDRLDLDRIVLAGHSRGGGAAFAAADRLENVLGIITLQGVDPIAFGYGAGDVTSLPTLAMTAGNDVDLHYPRVEPVEDRLGGPYSWVNITGGTHAYTADIVPNEFDDHPGISRQNQHDLTELFTTAFLHSVTGEPRGDELLYSLRGVEVARDLSPYGAYQRWRPPGNVVMIDDFDRRDPAKNDLGGPNSSDGFDRAEEVFTYRPNSDRERGRYGRSRALLLSSTRPASYRTSFDPLDVSETSSLEFRVKGPDFGVVAPGFVVMVEHETSAYEVVVDESHVGPVPLGNRFQQVVVPLETPGDPLHALELRIPGGTLMIDDLRLAPPSP